MTSTDVEQARIGCRYCGWTAVAEWLELVPRTQRLPMAVTSGSVVLLDAGVYREMAAAAAVEQVFTDVTWDAL